MGVLMSGAASTLSLETFLGYVKSVSGWFWELGGETITFLINNPALLIWPAVSLLGAGLIYVKKFL